MKAGFRIVHGHGSKFNCNEHNCYEVNEKDDVNSNEIVNGFKQEDEQF